MSRTDIINAIITKLNAKKYLEIGVCRGLNFENVNCKYKLGVDPSPESKALIIETSDEFFTRNKIKFDVIFIDGLHTKEQVKKDIINSLSFLNEGGIIICHDMNPEEEIWQIEEYTPGELWTGPCWKTFVELRMFRSDLEMFVVNTDFGCAIIRKGKQATLKVEGELTYSLLEANRKTLLNLISVEEFNYWLENI